MFVLKNGYNDGIYSLVKDLVRVYISFFGGCGLHFPLFPKDLFDASFETLFLFKTHYSDKFRICEEIKTTSFKEEDKNSSILCIKMY